jgi:hypothetical protein
LAPVLALLKFYFVFIFHLRVFLKLKAFVDFTFFRKRGLKINHRAANSKTIYELLKISLKLGVLYSKRDLGFLGYLFAVKALQP